MDFKVFLSPDALIDLERIVVYIGLDDVAAGARWEINCSIPRFP
jgi:plasmid stabilization system protein ParE